MNTALTQADQDQIEAFLSKGVNLPPQPRILTEIDAVASKRNASMRSISDLVGRDAALTARMFKIIHSPFFGLRREIDSLDQAISIMGLEAALTVIKTSALKDAIGGNSQAMDAFWERANDIAGLCAQIAKKQRSVLRIAPEHAHMAGLFHDCGVPILMQRFPTYCKDLARAWPDLATEDEQHKTSHAVAGYLVARNWKLPDNVCQAVRHHHELENVTDTDRTLTALLLMAIHLYNLTYGRDDTEWDAVEAMVLTELGLTAVGQIEFQEEIVQSFQEAQS